MFIRQLAIIIMMIVVIVAILKIVIVLAFEGLGGSFKGSAEAIYSGSGLYVLRVALRAP